MRSICHRFAPMSLVIVALLVGAACSKPDPQKKSDAGPGPTPKVDAAKISLTLCDPGRTPPDTLILCQNPPTGEPVKGVKAPVIINTLNWSICAQQKIYWTSNDGDSGLVTLANDLPPSKQIQVLGTNYNNPNYFCSAWANSSK